MFASRAEIEYLNAQADASERSPALVREMYRRLEALRRYDQHFGDADWHPDSPSRPRRRQPK